MSAFSGEAGETIMVGDDIEMTGTLSGYGSMLQEKSHSSAPTGFKPLTKRDQPLPQPTPPF